MELSVQHKTWRGKTRTDTISASAEDMFGAINRRSYRLFGYIVGVCLGMALVFASLLVLVVIHGIMTGGWLWPIGIALMIATVYSTRTWMEWLDQWTMTWNALHDKTPQERTHIISGWKF
jgi:hypothetical protein